MKPIFYLISLCVAAITVSAQNNVPFTNHVAIAKTGVCISLTDGQHPTNDVEVFADIPLHWILENETNKVGRLVHQGPQNQFSLKLVDSQGGEVPVTDYGKWMNSGPHHWGATESVHAFLLSPHEKSDRDFPKLTEIFRIAQPGEFILEAKYWYLSAYSNEWQLSDAVRLRVVERAKPVTEGGPQNMAIPTSTVWTNYIAVDDSGIYMSLTDDKPATPEDWKKSLMDTQILADAPLHWVLHNRTENVVRLEDDGIQHSYDLKLFEASGREVARTEYGKWINSGPRSPDTGMIQTMEFLPDNRIEKDFPAIENFFDIPHDGEYVLEARRLYLNVTNNKWQMSDPVRLKVIKPPRKNEGGVKINSSSQ